MLRRLVAFALSQRLFVMLGVLLVIGAGAVLLPGLPIDAFPDVSPVQVKIIVKAPGLTPEEVEQRITVPAVYKDLPTLDEAGLKGFNVSIWHGPPRM